MRVVLDTNIIVSALFWGGTPGVVLDKALAKEFTLLASEELFLELQDVLSRPKFADQLAKRSLSGVGIISDYRTEAITVQPATVPLNVVRDPKDRMLLACAAGGQANHILSGDKDLLVLASYQNIPILSAEQFLQKLAETDS